MTPLGVIVAFVALSEVVAGLVARIAGSDHYVILPVVWFVVVFPIIVCGLFFGTLWAKYQNFYGPQDYRGDDEFRLILNRLANLEVRVDATDVDPLSPDLEIVFVLMRQLLANDKVKAAKNLGRRYLKVRRFVQGVVIFEHLVHEVAVSNPYHDALLSNLGYCYIGRQKFHEAKAVFDAMSGSKEFWHSAAQAYCYFRLGDKDSSERWLAQCKAAPGYWDAVGQLISFYPDMRNQMESKTTN